jgi:hypothetical protein
VSELTIILDRVENGDPKAAEELLPLIYDELRRVSVHAAIGKSACEGNRGEPDLRVYAGVKREFGAPWKRKERP